VEAGWAGHRPRPSGEGGRRLGQGEGGGPREEEGGAGRPKVNPRQLGQKLEMGPCSKEILFEFQLILEFGRDLENCTRRFRKKFDMGIFPKIF
jgi:hypothetical protein